jgi:hypothetical protein
MGQKEVGGLDIHMDYRPRTSIMKIHQSFTYAYCYLVSIFPFQHLLCCMSGRKKSSVKRYRYQLCGCSIHLTTSFKLFGDCCRRWEGFLYQVLVPLR